MKAAFRIMRSENISDFEVPAASIAAGSFYLNILKIQGFFTRKYARDFEILPQVQGK